MSTAQRWPEAGKERAEGWARKRENHAEKARERGLTQMENERKAEGREKKGRRKERDSETRKSRRRRKSVGKRNKKSMGIGYRRLVTVDTPATRTKATLPSPTFPVAKARHSS